MLAGRGPGRAAMVPLLLLAALVAQTPDAGLPAAENDAGSAAADAGALDGLDAGPSPSPCSGDAGAVDLRFSGNRVLPASVYSAVLQLPPCAEPDAQTAELVRNQLDAFLKRSGYDLERVQTRALAGHIDVDIDEGQLEKIVFRGKLTLKTMRFRLALSLPSDVYNRLELDRQLRTITEELHLEGVHYELVPSEHAKKTHLQVESLGPLNSIEGMQLLHPQAQYELHLFFTERPWDIGQGLDVRSSALDGLEVIGSSQGAGLLGEDDRWRLAASGGMGLRTRLSNSNYYPSFTRAYAEALYYASVPVVQPLFQLRTELISRQRADLALENYDRYIADALFNLQYEYARRQTVVVGVGFRYLNLFHLYAAPNAAELGGVPADIHPLQQVRTFAELRVNYLFEDGGDRWDRRHEVTLDARHFFALREEGQFGEARLEWQRVFALGWDDIFLRARGAWLWGGEAVPFPNEEVIGGVHLRNAFSNLYVHRAASASFEYRFSLTRDIIKLSVFNDAAVFGEVHRENGFAEVLRVGDSFGPGLNLLFQGMFQIDLYYGVGVMSAGKFDHGFSIGIQKVF